MNELQSLNGLDISRETYEKLKAFVALLTKWTRKINLIAPNTVNDIWQRHVADSAQIYTLAPKTWDRWLDIGSGGGLPALVIAILDEAQQPMTLIESDQRKCLFLQTVRRELSLNVTVLNARIETADTPPATVLSARALASLTDLLGHADRVLSPDGTAFFAKGARHQQELDQAAKTWHFDVTPHPSQTSDDARILEISGIRRREP